MRRRRDRRNGRAAYEGLRQQALDAVSQGLAPPGPEHPDVAGIVVDIPAGESGFATVVAMCDNTTSLYTSVGGGQIGAGTHPPVARATQALLATAQAHLLAFSVDSTTTHPPPGKVGLFVLTPDGRRRADVSEDAFWGRQPDPLVPVIARVQAVIAAIREVPPPRAA